MGHLKPFAESDFVVTWTGECAESRVIRGWDRVLAFIDYSTGAVADGWSCRTASCELHNEDNWRLLSFPAEDGDCRHTFSNSEFVYCAGLHIVRLTEPIASTIEATEVTA